ncbi:MAG: LD-carboxypeptidase [Burkholderiales bacterium]
MSAAGPPQGARPPGGERRAAPVGGEHTGPRGVGLYAPSGFALDPAAVDRAVARLEGIGLRVTVDPTCRMRWQRFAAPDDERLAAVSRMAADPGVDVAIALRGGYGWTRLLPRLDFAAIAAAGKRWLGYSDFTAFQLAALARAGMTTFAGPVVSGDFGASQPSAFTLDHCFGVLDGDTYAVECALEGPDLVCAGTLWGGNLAMVAHLVGTPYFPDVDGGILFLEDVGETPYRIERMLYQLHHAGILARQRAIVLGQFTEYALSDNDGGYDLDGAVAQLRAVSPTPIFTGLPFGHVPAKLTLPVGGRCELAVRGGAAVLALSDYDR